ncbi:MAG TPA: alpha/beta hydrolase-fold protein, partial [Spirochaetota bacterium]|nr:alpha/beta hydrolase-fold protein [Spirochaetota bacterium]
QISGDFTSWVYRLNLKRVFDTDLFYLSKKFPLDARLDYKIIVDERSILDPLNQNIVSGGFGDNSFFNLSNYKENSYHIYKNESPKGNLIKHNFYSNFLKEDRLFWVYLPPNYNPEKKYKTIYFQDGNEYIRLVNSTIILDNLISNKLIDEVVAVFVEPNIRHLDYLFNDNYVDYFIKEIINFTENSYSVSKKMEDRFIVGDSLGGLISAYIVYRYPGYFNGVLSHSGAFILADKQRVLYRGKFYKGNPFMDKLDKIELPKKWYLICGSYEKNIALIFDFTKGNIKFYNYLKNKNLVNKIELKLYNEGHSWGLWKNTLPEGLIWLLN